MTLNRGEQRKKSDHVQFTTRDTELCQWELIIEKGRVKVLARPWFSEEWFTVLRIGNLVTLYNLPDDFEKRNVITRYEQDHIHSHIKISDFCEDVESRKEPRTE